MKERSSGSFVARPPEARAYPSPSSEAVSRVMRSNTKRDTRPEVEARRLMHRLGLRYRKHHAISIPGRRSFVADVAFPTRKVAVLIDGCFWHGCPDHGTTPRANDWYWGPKLQGNIERDRATDAALARLGWVVLRFWEHEAPDDVAMAVARTVRAGA